MNKTKKIKKKENKSISKNASGITLIALIVTIIVLIILAGITLNLLMGDNGILTRAKDAKVIQKMAELEEKLETAKVTAHLKEFETGGDLLEFYLDSLKEEKIVNESNITRETAGTYLTLENKYVYYVQKIDNEIVYTYEGQVGKLLPRIKNAQVSNTDNTITVNITGVDVNKYNFYIKETENGSYTLKEQNNTSGTYIFTGLQENTTYYIKVEAINENGTVEREITKTIVVIPKGKVNIENWLWDAAIETGTFEVSTEETGYILQYTTTPSVESSWVTVTNGGRTTGIAVGQTVYGRLSDGENNETGNFSSVTVEKQDGLVILSQISETIYPSNSTTFNITSNISGGTLGVNSLNESIATASISGNVVTVESAGQIGTTQIIVTSAENTSYNEATATFTITVSKAELTSVTVQMTGYQYAGTKTNPSISGDTHGGTVTYYYNTNNSNSDGIAWTTVTSSTSINAGTYYMYAIVEEIYNRGSKF